MKRSIFLIFTLIILLILSLATAMMITSCDADAPESDGGTTTYSVEGGSIEAVAGDRVTVTGRCVVKGSLYLIIEDGSPFEMHAAGDGDMFAGLTTGDLIKIVRDTIVMKSYPWQVIVYSCEKLEDGDADDIPDSLRKTLASLGWMEEDIESKNESETVGDYGIMLPYETEPGGYVHESAATELVSYEYGHANMSLRVPEGWSYKVTESTDGLYPFGITLWPEYKISDTIELMYHPDGFGVCGTRLTEKESILGGKAARKGYYGPSQYWSFIACDSYAMVNHMADGTFALYRDDIELIEGSVVIGEGVVTRDEAIDAAASAAAVGYSYRGEAYFDHVSGTWDVKLYVGGALNTVALTATVDHEGNVTETEQFAILD